MTASVRALPAPIAMHLSTSTFRCHAAAKVPAISRKQVATKAARRPRLSRRASEDLEAASAEGAAEATATTSVMAMADSLVERAKEVATSGQVDEDFKSAFVPELEAELMVLRTRAEEAEANAATLEAALLNAKDQFVRMSADFDNFRKRSAAEKTALAASVKGDTVMTLVPLVDNFELAKAAIKVESEGEARIDAAYQGLYKQMVELFRGLGLEAVPGVGAPFDPELHEAIMREPSEDVPDGTVLEEFRKGFSLGGKLLRPAMVKVSFSDAPAPAAAEAEPAAASE